MPADREPDFTTPLQDDKGNTNPVWWRFWARVAGQFSGKDAPVMPVNVPGVLSVANAQARPRQLTEAAVMEAAEQLLAAIRRPPEGNSAALDLAAIAGRARQFVNREAGALDLAAIALSRIRPAQAAQAPQIIVCTQATFPVLAGTGPTFVYVSDFAHWIYWDGTTATFADGGSDYYTVAAAAPSAIGWHAVDGSTVSFLNADGTLTVKTLKNVAGTPAYLKVGAGGDTLAAPVVPLFTGTPQTFAVAAVTPTGAVNALITPNPYTPAGTIGTTGEPESFYSTLWFRL